MKQETEYKKAIVAACPERIGMDYKKINEEFHSKLFWRVDRDKSKWFTKYVMSKIINKFMIGVSKGVLYDAGGGTGNHSWFFGSGFKKVIVSDISKTALSRIQEEGVVKLNCSVLANELPDNYVDCIFLIDVFEHIDHKDLLTMMKDLRRILKPDGRIIMFASHFGWGLGTILQKIIHPNKRLRKGEQLEGHVNRLKYEEFDNLFKDAKLSIKDHRFYSIFFQQFTDRIKEVIAKGISSLRGKGTEDVKMGREGQSTKEEIRKKETKLIFKIPLLILSWISYLDIFLGKFIKGTTVFFYLTKNENET